VPEPPGLRPDDAALARLLAEETPGRGRALDVGCGVGRGVFLLTEHLGMALGVDRSAARVRRARNVAATRADFFLPAPPGVGPREVPLELSRLARDGADFAVAAADALPLADGALDAVVLRAGDGLGPWADAAAALAEAVRVVAPGGLLVLEAGLPAPGGAWRAARTVSPFSAWRRG
jgi:SAM-dependent methyltransferase